MKNKKYHNNRLINFMHGLIILSFAEALLQLIVMLLIEFTPLKLEWKGFSLNPPNKNGYSIPVVMTVNNLPDTAITVNVKRPKIEYGENYTVRNFGKTKYKSIGYDTLINDTSAKVEMSVNKWVANDMNHLGSYTGKDQFDMFSQQIKDSKLDIDYSVITSTVYIKAKGKTIWQNIILGFDGYFKLFVTLILILQLLKIFKRLQYEITFMNNLGKRVRNLAIILVVSQIILLLFSYFYARTFGSITLIEANHSNERYNGLNVYFNPTSGANMSVFLLGLALFIAAMLFKHGKELEEEAHLTI